MKRAGRRWFPISFGAVLLFLCACGGGGGGGGGGNPAAPLQVDAGPDQSVYQGQTVTLDGSSSSTAPGETITSYLWEQVAGTTVVLNNNTAANPTFTAPFASTPTEDLQFELVVTDSRDSTASDNVSVTVFWAQDDFSTDTREFYDTQAAFLDNTSPVPMPQFNYDPVGERLQIVTDNDVGLIFSRSIPADNNGVFSLDFFPIRTYPKGGGVWIRLKQDEGNFYELAIFEWDDPSLPHNFFPTVTKWVGGVPVNNVAMTHTTSYMSQDPPSAYHVIITFTPDNTVVQWAPNVPAFSEEVVLDKNTAPINVSKFEIQTNQQDAYYDNIATTLP
jgi:hypothetical protein